MIFNSQDFIIFFIILVPLYFFTPHKHRRFLLLTASYFFYGWWNPAYLVLIFASTITDYFAAKIIFKTQKKTKQHLFLIISLFVNLGILFSFKYLNFAAETLNIVKKGSKIIDVLLPVGISFYTFQTISYTIDVYRKKLKPEKNILNFALFVAFFPQLVAGPIERAGNILPQLRKKIKFNPQRVSAALYLIIWGFFQKVVVADNLGVFVDTVFNNPHNYKGINIAVANFFFAFQIYADFAGYTNIARGIALLLGINLSFNFRQPYFANSIRDFWHRWHISLSSWFKDYVYISLGGNKIKLSKWIFVVFITFFLSGLWHGANSTFVLWGVFNGLIYIIEAIFRKLNSKRDKITFRNNKIYKYIRIFVTFFIVYLLWIFFRANNISDIPVIFNNLITPEFKLIFDHKWTVFNFLMILIMILVDYIEQKKLFHKYIMSKKLFIKSFVIYFLLLMIIFMGNWQQAPFIYFQF